MAYFGSSSFQIKSPEAGASGYHCMLLLYLIILLSLIGYTRFFYINSLRTKILRHQTLHAAVKAIYFIPLFVQGTFIFCMSLIYFYSSCKGFFFLIDGLVFFKPAIEQELNFLLFFAFLSIAGLLLSLNFMLAKISMNANTDTLSLLNKIAYLIVSSIILVIVYYNFSLVYPDSNDSMIVYNEPSLILLAIVGYLIILLRPLFGIINNKNFHYLQLAVKITLTYIVLCFFIALLVFLVYVVLKYTV